MVQDAHSKQREVVWWLYRNTRVPRAMESVLMAAVYNGDIGLLEWLQAKYCTQGFDLDTEMEENEMRKYEEEEEADLSEGYFLVRDEYLQEAVASR
ncbi:hypothetical protein PHYPSEUDO_014088 [Phytophthora pseudosyringae]|uniref:Uncharacterized protein n=1 Tax=Phytophthora pseudosyringae TaxID=221518 RepID=A0A8T1W5J0_9STRA|nr:hypothetical protein PHYPSEUDO_014088 [Phytophthora pseudosyringae]